MVLPPDAVDQRDVVERRKTVVERCSRDGRVADVVIVDERAEFTAELPPCHAGVRRRKIRDRRRTAREAERHQLVFRREVRLRDPLKTREGKLVGLTRVLGRPVDAAGVVVERPASGVHEALDHGVGMRRRVGGLRCIRSAGDALSDLAQARHQFRDIAILGIVWRTPEIPDDRVRGGRSNKPARRPDVLDHCPIGFIHGARRIRWLLIRVAGEHDQTVGDDASLDGLVLVIVRADEARHHDRARCSRRPGHLKGGWVRPR